MSDIVHEKRDGISVITFNRPSVLNAFREETRAEFLAVLDEVAVDGDIRVVVMTGNGRAFSSGEDLGELEEMLAETALMTRAQGMLARFQELTRRIVGLTKPTIAAMNGVAVGLGAELAIACDIRIASEAASIGFVEVKRALFETNGVMYFLPRLVGYGRAAELLLSGDLITAKRAADIGLVNRVVPPDRLMSEALSLASSIAKNAPISLRLVKEVLRQTYDHDLETMMKLEEEGMMECFASDDLKEGTKAFLEKRAPSYRGE